MEETTDAISRLSKEATQLRYADSDAAMATLKEVKALMLTCTTSYPVKQWLRLPQFLLEAGRHAEAMAELNELRKSLPVARHYVVSAENGQRSLTSKETLKMLMHADLVEIYKEMCTVAAYSGQQALSNEFQRKSEYHEAAWEALNRMLHA